MAANRTVPHGADVDRFLNAVEHPARRKDAIRLLEIMTVFTGEPPRMWGESIAGFGEYRYRTATGRSCLCICRLAKDEMRQRFPER